MKMSVLQLAALVLGASGALALPAGGLVDEPAVIKPNPRHRTDFDMWMFAITWPGAECATDRGCHYQDAATDPLPLVEFLLHGLWPNRKDGGWPQYCCESSGCEFDVQQLNSIEEMLHTCWPSYHVGNSDFWKHEWDKHGTCALMDMLPYFEKALELRQKYNLLDMLEAGGISQSDNAKYTLRDIERVVKEQLGTHAVLLCNTGSNGAAQLSEVRICLDLDTFQPFDCSHDDIYSQGCYTRMPLDGEITFPPYDPEEYIPSHL
eukprot:Rmarinus@m.10374